MTNRIPTWPPKGARFKLVKKPIALEQIQSLIKKTMNDLMNDYSCTL
jgi:hypothetical protein